MAQAALKSKPEYTIDNYDCDVGNLYHLLGAATEALLELDYGTGPTRNHDLDRAAALVEIGRHMAERMLQRRGVEWCYSGPT